MSDLLTCSGGMDPSDDDTALDPDLLADDDQLREALAVVCKRTTDANPCECVTQKVCFLRDTLDDGTYAIVTELVAAITRHHEEIVFCIARDLLWRWAESDAANGVGS